MSNIHEVNVTDENLYLELWQYDAGQKLKFVETSIADGSHVLFANSETRKAIRKEVANNEVGIPNKFLRATGKMHITIETLNENEETTLYEINGYIKRRQDGEPGTSPEDEPTFIQKIIKKTIELAQSVRDDADNGVFDGDDGYSPQVTVKTETPSTYILHIKDADHEYDTPNLQGQGGEGTLDAGDGLKREGNVVSVDLSDDSNQLLRFLSNKLYLGVYDIGYNSDVRQALTEGSNYPLASKNYVDGLMSGATKWEFVSQLPTEDIDTHTIYFVPKQSAETDNIYDEWVYAIQSRNPDVYDWELLGTNEVDLSNYQTLISASNKVNADYIDDSESTNKFTNATEKTEWSGKSRVYNAKFVDNEIDLRQASYPNIQQFDLLMDKNKQRFFYCEYLNELGGIQGHWVEKVKSIIGTPPATVSVSQDPLAELFVDDVLLSDNGNIYRVLTKDLSSLPEIAYTYQTYGADLSNYDTSAQVDAKILNKTNKIWNAVYLNGELSRERSDYDGIKVRDLIFDYKTTKKIYEVYMLSSYGVSLREMSNVYAISGTPPTVSTHTEDGEIYFKDCVYFSDNGNIYYCIDRDDSQAPSQFTFTWEVYKGTDTTYSASTGLSLNNGAFSVDNPLPSSAQADSGKLLLVNSSGNAEWQTKTYEDKTTISTDTTSTTDTLDLLNNTEQRYTQELSSLTLTLPLTIDDDFISSVVFASGTTATQMTYDSSIKWSGDDVTSNAFVPVASKTYNIVMWYDGLNINGVVRGVA